MNYMKRSQKSLLSTNRTKVIFNDKNGKIGLLGLIILRKVQLNLYMASILIQII